MIALGMVAAFAIYGQVQEVFYVAPLQLTVFAACGLAAALEAPPGPADRSRRRLGIVAALLAAGLAAHVVHAYVVPGRLADEYRDREISRAGERLSAPVLDADGQYFQWTGARAVITVPRQATELSFELRQPGAASRDVEVRFDGRTDRSRPPRRTASGAMSSTRCAASRRCRDGSRSSCCRAATAPRAIVGSRCAGSAGDCRRRR